MTTPAESSLEMHLIAVIRSLFWVDTRAMLADALTKGGVDREVIHTTAASGQYVCPHDGFRLQKDQNAEYEGIPSATHPKTKTSKQCGKVGSVTKEERYKAGSFESFEEEA